jgi:hypothetical protein
MNAEPPTIDVTINIRGRYYRAQILTIKSNAPIYDQIGLIGFLNTNNTSVFTIYRMNGEQHILVGFTKEYYFAAYPNTDRSSSSDKFPQYTPIHLKLYTEVPEPHNNINDNESVHSDNTENLFAQRY